GRRLGQVATQAVERVRVNVECTMPLHDTIMSVSDATIVLNNFPSQDSVNYIRFNDMHYISLRHELRCTIANVMNRDQRIRARRERICRRCGTEIPKHGGNCERCNKKNKVAVKKSYRGKAERSLCRCGEKLPLNLVDLKPLKKCLKCTFEEL